MPRETGSAAKILYEVEILLHVYLLGLRRSLFPANKKQLVGNFGMKWFMRTLCRSSRSPAGVSATQRSTRPSRASATPGRRPRQWQRRWCPDAWAGLVYARPGRWQIW
jgi:hypothetical protein